VAWLRTHFRRIASILALAIAALVVVGVAASTLYSVTGKRPGNFDHAIRVACHDAHRLQRARMLDEAHARYERIARLEHGEQCKALVPGPAEYRRWAATYAERADGYLRAADLKSDTPNTPALRRAANALVTSLGLDPFGSTAHADFKRVMAALGQPRTRAEANEDCARAGLLRAARLLDEAEVMYARALRSGRHTRCFTGGLQKIRMGAGLARRNMLAAASLKSNGHQAEARLSYLQTLRRNASLTDARQAVLSLPAPKLPRTTRRHAAMDTIGGWLDWLTNALKWLGDHVAVAVVAGIALIPVIWFVMWMLLTASRIGLVRRWMDLIPPLRRFTRTRTRVAAFTPAEDGSSCGSLFAHYLSLPRIRNGKPTGFAIDGFEATTASTDRVSAASVVAAIPNAGALGAALTWFGEHAPGRNASLFGQLVKAGPDRFGLRVVVVGRNGRGLGSRTFWSADLPGPAYGKDDEDAARAALSILAASWAYEMVDT